MTTPEYLNYQKAQGQSQIAFCAFTKYNEPEYNAELKQLESMLKRGDVELGRKNASMSYPINETLTQQKK